MLDFQNILKDISKLNSKQLQKLKEDTMLKIHENKIPYSLDQLKQFNINIDIMIKNLKALETK